jgi:serine protease Do
MINLNFKNKSKNSMNFKSVLLVVAVSASTAVLSVWGYNKIQQRNNYVVQEAGKLPVNYAGFKNYSPENMVDFTAAATAATPAVVHIKTKTKAKQVSNTVTRRSPFSDFFGDDFDDFFGGPRMNIIPEQQASGSGVLISQDGYIVTNNHVVEGADEVTVTLSNKKNYTATVVSADPNSDLAVIKISGTNFPYIVYGNSDDTRLGQWVLAIGYPLNLDVTVTAGIVSAKARSININKGNSPIESFIQTDAAVNRGNSGGALINTAGELIGINSAIASPTGAYAGYSYAIPVNIVKKIVNDMIKYGVVQRAYLGVNYLPDNAPEEQKKAQGIKEGDGVYVTGVQTNSGAEAAGIKAGDFIKKINNITINGTSELAAIISGFKPGDKVPVTFVRNGKESTVTVTLRNKAGNTDVVKAEVNDVLEKLGGNFVTLDKTSAQKYNIPAGVLVKSISENGLIATTSRMQEGFVITKANGQAIKSVEDLQAALKGAKGQVQIEGVYPGYDGSWRYPVNLNPSGE